MQLAERQKIFEDVTSLAECVAPKHRGRAEEIINRVKSRLNPADGRQAPKSEEHRAKISAAFELRRETEVFTIKCPETNQSVEITGIFNLMQATRLALSSIRVRFSSGRGQFPFSYKGAGLIVSRTGRFAEKPDNNWQKAMGELVRA
jgi:hypothetical protein